MKILVSSDFCINQNFNFSKSKRNKKSNIDYVNDAALRKDNLTKFVTAGIALAGFTGVTIGAVALSKKTSRINSLKKEMSKYQNDIRYRKSMLNSLSLPEDNYYKLRSIVGADEFHDIIKKISNNKENFLPGNVSYRNDMEVVYLNKENVKSGKFAANLHIHTKYSDGKLSIPELLEQAVNYADERVAKLGKENPFYIAITDHDGVSGCKDVINLILKKPKKYKNLRIILGIEHTTKATHPDALYGPVDLHLLNYCINPYDVNLNKLLDKSITGNKNNINKALQASNVILKDKIKPLNFEYNYDELLQLAPHIDTMPINSNYYLKDYLQFKLIYSSVIENNRNISKFIKSNKIDMNYAMPISFIPKNPDYSNGQKYYEYYFDGIKQYLKSYTKSEKHDFIDNELKQFPKHLRETLNKIEEAVNDKNSDLFVPNIKHNAFEDVVNYLTKLDDGVLGIAHPGVVFPYKNLKNNAETLKFYDDIYKKFKDIGGARAKYAEDNYAAYYKSNLKLAEELSKLSKQYGLEKTGGLDTHIKDIFSSK